MNDPYIEVEEPISSISRNETEPRIENHKYSNHNGGNFIITKHEHKILPIFSRKYTLDQGSVHNGSPETQRSNINGKYSEREPTDSVITHPPLPRRGILKNNLSEPIESINPSPKPPRHANSESDIHTKGKYRLHFPHFKRRTEDSSQEFINPAFEPDDTPPKDFKLRDLVAQVLKRQPSDDFLHPYGRTDIYTAVFLGHDSKPRDQTDGSKLAFWGILLFIILGITGGIIFMAEMHKLENHQNNTTTLD